MKRKKWIDVSKGIGIVMIVIGHCWPIHDSSIVRSLIYAVHVPLFFVISGYLFREREPMKLVKKNIHSLIVPYLFTSSFLIGTSYLSNHVYIPHMYSMGPTKRVILAAFYGIGDNTTLLLTDYAIPFIGSIWFLLAMLIGNQMFNLTINMSKKIKWMLYILPTILSILGFLISKWIVLPFSINAALISQLFYFFGYYLKNQKNDLDRKTIALLGVIVWTISGFSGIFYLTSGVSSYPVISKLGKYSIVGLCFHLIDLNAFTIGNELLEKYGIYVLIAYRLMFVFVAIYIVSRIKFLKRIFNIN